MNKFVVPLLKDSINTFTTAARILSPIAGVKYIHDWNKNKRKLEVVMFKNLSYSLPMEMIVWHVIEDQNYNTRPQQRDLATLLPVLVQ